MYSVTKLIHLTAHGDACAVIAELRAIADASAAMETLIEPTLPGVRNGGDILMHMRFRNRVDWAPVAKRFAAVLTTPAVTHVDGAEYWGATSPTDATQPATVYRTLLLRVAPCTDGATLDRFEADLRLLPRYVRTITAWQLSRVDSAIGASPWTHVFEQEFVDLEGLVGPYLRHPIHWAYVDRWFDPECPEVIVRDRVCHSFCRIGETRLKER
jgi:hypothetical protein